MIPKNASPMSWIWPVTAHPLRWALALAASLALLALPALAHVYPTNLKINDGFTNAVVDAGTGVNISYILNEPASAGVTVKILSGAGSAVRTISLASGSPGTLRGTNTVVWNGNGDDANPVPAASYSVAVTAASHGFAGWTQTSDDSADGNQVWEGRGIAVDQNTNSPYYGRVFVSNAEANDPGQNNWLGWRVGILKCNADGSYADEGGVSTGGYPWAGDLLSPWHLEVSRDDFVYVDDFTTNGQVIRWDATISTNSELFVLRPDNWPNLDVSLSGPALFRSGTNMSLWMADTTFTGGTQIGLGILRYSLGPDGACATNDTGTIAVAVGDSLTTNPQDVALDAAGHIYTIQSVTDQGAAANRVFRFPPYGPGTNAAPLTNAQWAVGASDDTMAGANGLAVDPTGTYVAVAFVGLASGPGGCTQILYATNGAVVTNLDLGITISGDSDHEDHDCAWDAVGNVYYLDNVHAVWRAVSPPGTNQATTVALATVQVVGVGPVVPPQIKDITVAGGVVAIDFSAGTNDTASNFSVVGATNVSGPYFAVTGASISRIAPAQFRATFPAASDLYFRIVRHGGTPPPAQLAFNKISIAGQNVVLSFTGNTTDSASSFTLLSTATVGGAYLPAPGATIAQLAPGNFQATVTNSGAVQFYRIRK